MNKKLLMLLSLIVIPSSIYFVYCYNSEENKSDRAKVAVYELITKKSYTDEQLYDLADEAERKGERYKAFYLLQAAADKGLDSAEFRLGRYYCSGYGTNEDHSQAIKWMTKAAEKGRPEYQYHLGSCYDSVFQIDNMDKNYMHRMAAKYFLLAAEQGYSDAQAAIAQCYRLGRGVEKNLNEAERWYMLAQKQGVDVDFGLIHLYIETYRYEQAIPLLQEEISRGRFRTAKQILNGIPKEILNSIPNNIPKEILTPTPFTDSPRPPAVLLRGDGECAGYYPTSPSQPPAALLKSPESSEEQTSLSSTTTTATTTRSTASGAGGIRYTVLICIILFLISFTTAIF